MLKGDLPENLKNDAEMYAGCVSGAIQMDEYVNIIQKTGFTAISIQKGKVVVLPDEILTKYLNQQEIEDYNSGKFGIFSITVYGQKPCCDPSAGCC